MTFRKLYHTHPNPSVGRNEPLFITVEGMTCDKCEKTYDEISGEPAGDRVQTSEHNVAEDRPKRGRRSARPVHSMQRVRRKNQLQHGDVDEGQCLDSFEDSCSGSNSGSKATAPSISSSESGYATTPTAVRSVKTKRKRKVKDSSENNTNALPESFKK